MTTKNKPAAKEPFKFAPMKVTESLPVDREQLSFGIEFDDHLERERELKFEQMKARFNKLGREGQVETIINESIQQMIALERQSDIFAWQVIRMQKHRFGRNTEKLSREELAIFIRALGGTAEEANAAEPNVPTPPVPPEMTDADADEEGNPGETPPAPKPKPRTRKDKTRVLDEAKVPTVEHKHGVEGADRVCVTCGLEKATIGWTNHEQLEYEPARFVRHRTLREKCACPKCHDGVTVATGDEVPWDGLIGPSILARLIEDKCDNRMPLYRQGQEFETLGVHIPAKTIDSCFAYAMDELAPIALCERSEVLGMEIVGTDDTKLKTLLPGGKGVSRGHLWCFVGTDGTVNGQECVAYGYTASWKASEIQPWFSAMDGNIQCDDYAGYGAEVEVKPDGSIGLKSKAKARAERAKDVSDDPTEDDVLVAVPDERRLGCGMHVRRKFVDALTSKDIRAAQIIKHFQDIYEIEDRCKRDGVTAEQRTEVRRVESIPILEMIDAWVDAKLPTLLPKTPLYKACKYAKNQRIYLRRCFEDGRFEIDNGRTERHIRPIAVGRRVFLFTGSARGGERLADAYTLMASCKRHGIEFRVYATDVLKKLQAGWPAKRLSELTPRRWAEARRAEAEKEVETLRLASIVAEAASESELIPVATPIDNPQAGLDRHLASLPLVLTAIGLIMALFAQVT